MGFDGTSVTPQIRELIEKYHIGSILLTAKNLKSKVFGSSIKSKFLKLCSCGTYNITSLRASASGI
jgi:hypothetical protein